MASRKYQSVNKNGDISDRRIKGGKNLKENYVKVGKQDGRNVYAKKGSGFENEGRTHINANKGKRLTLFEFVRVSTGGGGRPSGQVKREEKGEQLVEVKGLVSAFAVSDGIARRKNSPFSAEMLFTWWGNRGFDERRLLSSAWEILLDSLADMDRINMPLISSLTMDEGRGGIESVNEVRVESEQFNEMEYTVFIPNIKGRAYFKGSAKVVL
jgi:hypothetical protein